MSREDAQMKIRLPDELKRLVEASASGAGRSLNAEIVARLSASFDGGGPGVAMQMDLFTTTVQARSELLSLRADIVKSRLDALVSRMTSTSAEANLLAQSAKTDAELEAVERKAQELKAVAHESQALKQELVALRKEREQLLTQLEELHTAASKKLGQLSPGLDADRTRPPSPKG